MGNSSWGGKELERLRDILFDFLTLLHADLKSRSRKMVELRV